MYTKSSYMKTEKKVIVETDYLDFVFSEEIRA